jgi:hypothetical protein
MYKTSRPTKKRNSRLDMPLRVFWWPYRVSPFGYAGREVIVMNLSVIPVLYVVINSFSDIPVCETVVVAPSGMSVCIYDYHSVRFGCAVCETVIALLGVLVCYCFMAHLVHGGVLGSYSVSLR